MKLQEVLSYRKVLDKLRNFRDYLASRRTCLVGKNDSFSHGKENALNSVITTLDSLIIDLINNKLSYVYTEKCENHFSKYHSHQQNTNTPQNIDTCSELKGFCKGVNAVRKLLSKDELK